MSWTESELWFYGGMILMALSVVLAIPVMIVFRAAGCRLRNKLEQEYGKRH